MEVTNAAEAAETEEERAEFVIALGEELHHSGVACDDLENTLTDVARFVDIPLQVFALPTMLMFAFGPPHAQRVIMRRVNPGPVHLRRLAFLDSLYADVQAGKLGVKAALGRLQHLDEELPRRSSLATIVANALVAFGVAVILGGGSHELVVATLIGVVTGSIAVLTTRFNAFARLFEVSAAFAGTLVVALYVHFSGHPANLYVSVVAGVVILLPGYSLTLALHELANQNIVSGTARLGQVFMTLIALSCGALLGLAVAGPNFLHEANIRPQPVGATFWIGAVILASIGLSLALHARARDMWVVFASSLVAVGSAHVFGALPLHAIATFFAAFVCGMVANLGARMLHLPQPVFLIPALMMLVPGSLSYESVLFIFSGTDLADAAKLATNAVIAAIFIVAGLLLSQLLIPAGTLRRYPAREKAA